MVVADPELSGALGLAEYQRLVFEPTHGDPHTVTVDYDAPIFDRMGCLVAKMGRMGVAGAARADLKPSDPKAELERALTIVNGVYRFRTCVAAALCDDRVHYLCASCFSPCPQCAKPFCDACHGTCPRRH